MIHCRSAACPQLSVEELPTGVNYGAEVIGSLITASSPFTIAINGTVPQQEFRVVPDLPCSSLTLVVFVVPDRGCRVELKHRCPQPRLRASSSQCGHDCQLLAVFCRSRPPNELVKSNAKAWSARMQVVVKFVQFRIGSLRACASATAHSPGG